MSEALATAVPEYPDDHARQLGERLLDVYEAHRARPGDASVATDLESARRAVRRGPVLHPGEIVCDRFRLLARICDGALATTWRGWDLDLDGPVAVKVLHARFTGDPAAVEQFFDAAARMAVMEHPALPRIRLPRGVYEGFQLFVTDFHGQVSLDRAVASGMDRWLALQATLEAARALSSAHERGLFHRDLHPGNVYVGDDGEAWLTDFDLAPPSLGQHGSAYLAPEAMEPDAPATAAADIYALAMTMLFALHGRALPFWVLRDPERLIRSVDAPEPLRDALRKASSWDPEERFTSVDELLTHVLSLDDVVLALAESALAAGRHALAATHYRTLVSRGDGHPHLRVGLARALVAQEQLDRASQQLMLALQDARLVDVDAAVAELRGLSARTGDWAPLRDALSKRAAEPGAPRDALLLEVARITADHPEAPGATLKAWQDALDAHTTRDQARIALAGLLRLHEGADDWEAFAATARELMPLLPDEGSDGELTRPSLQHRLGRVFLEQLSDQHSGLVWLERAHESGFQHPELAPTLERIRSARGDWDRVIGLMRDQAAAQPDEEAVRTLRRAARIARYASQDPDLTTSVYEALAAREAGQPHGDADAMGWLARDALEGGATDAALRWLARLPPKPSGVRWVADTWLRARLLVAAQRVDDALSVLEALLTHAPTHLQALTLQARLKLERGELHAARRDFERVLATVSCGDTPSELGAAPAAREREARLALSDLACWRGELDEALTHAHEAVTDGDPASWWRVSRVSLLALGEAGADLPWLRATPLVFTPHEALARLLAGTLSTTGILAWLARDPLGAALARGTMERGNVPVLELATLVVDLLVRRELVGPTLFERLTEAFPEAGVSVEAVRWLWCEGPADGMFPVAESYRWSSGAAVVQDFDPAVHREVLHLDPPLSLDPVSPATPLHDAYAWQDLLMRDPDAPLPIERAPGGTSTATPQLPLERPRRLVVQLEVPIDGLRQRVVDGERLALGPDGLGLPGVDATLLRYGNRAYVVGTDVLVDGLPVEEQRLRGGEQIDVGGHALRVLLLESHEALPDEPGAPAPEITQPLDELEPVEVDEPDDAGELVLDEPEPISNAETVPIPRVPPLEAWTQPPVQRTEEPRAARRRSPKPVDREPEVVEEPAAKAEARVTRPVRAPAVHDGHIDEVPPSARVAPTPAPEPAKGKTSPPPREAAPEERAPPGQAPSASKGRSSLKDRVPPPPARARATAAPRPAKGGYDDLDLGEYIADDDDPTIDLSDPVGIDWEDDDAPAAVFRTHRGGREERIPFRREVFVVGRDPSDDIFVDLPGVGFLYRLHRRGDGYRVEEALVDGTREERPLRDGETLDVDGTQLTFRVLDGPKATPPPIRTPVPQVRDASSMIPLLVQDGGAPDGRVVPVRASAFTIGRGRKNDLQLPGDAKISRLHCTLVRGSDGIVKLRDNGSSNGTYVNDRKIREHILQVGDIILVGDHEFEFRLARPDDEEIALEEPSLSLEIEDSERAGHPTQLVHVEDLRSRR